MLCNKINPVIWIFSKMIQHIQRHGFFYFVANNSVNDVAITNVLINIKNKHWKR